MTQEEKELLLKDLCARLPYRLKIKSEKYPFPVTILYCGNIDEVKFRETGGIENICTIKPYLFPMSSMTEEQYKEFIITSGWDGDIEEVRRGKFSFIGYMGFDYVYDTIDWCNKNHFDYRGLIPKGLAIDATGLNIY